MGSYDKNVKVVFVVVLVTAMNMVWTDAAISCGTVDNKLAPCLAYLIGTAVSPSGGCCGGVKALYQTTAASRADRITSCNCIKTVASSLGGRLKEDRVENLARVCGVNLGYTPTLETNCNSIP